MKTSSIIWTVVIIVVVVVAGLWWWSASSQSPVAMQTITTTSTPAGTNPGGNPSTNPTTNSTTPIVGPIFALTLNNSGGGQFGSYLSASNGMTLYQSTKDTTNVSNCTGACATAWPPYIVTAAIATAPTTDPGITGKIGTIKRPDGSLQLTYRGLPLYFYAGDTKAGDTNGEAVNGFTEVAP